MRRKCVLLSIFSEKKNQERYLIPDQSEDISLGATCFDIQTSANASVRIMSKHVTLD